LIRFALAFALVATSLAAPETRADQGDDAVRVKLSGQYLVRYRHVEGQDFAPGGDRDYLSHRARLGVRLDYRSTRPSSSGSSPSST
jgi:hypothetical protein